MISNGKLTGAKPSPLPRLPLPIALLDLLYHFRGVQGNIGDHGGENQRMQIQVIDHAMNNREEQHRYGKHRGALERFFRRVIASYELMHDEGGGIQH